MEASSLSISSPSSSPREDGFDMLDLTTYDTASYQSPSLSPTGTDKSHFVRPSPAGITTPTSLPPNQLLCGPSHQYERYKQQTPFVPGALANTLAINESNARIAGFNTGYIAGEEAFDFNTVAVTPSNDMMVPSNMDFDFGPPADANFFFPTPSTINPQVASIAPPQSATQTVGVGRMYPGMHQRAAMAKQAHIQQQQQQQERLQRQNQQRRQQQQQHQKQSRPKTQPPTDPIVEQKITQVLNSMRTKSASSEHEDNAPLYQPTRTKKEEDDMDDDERLLASEEGKKLSSKERRQLRNKVSARAFRSRRKEYIGQLEGDLTAKQNEINDLRAANFSITQENRRLLDLTRMLLSAPSFRGLLEELSTDPDAASLVQRQLEPRQPELAQVPKDVNPYHVTNTAPQQQQLQQQQQQLQQGQQQQHHQIGMVMMPEQRVDLSMLNLNPNFSYQPQVFAVIDTPELPEIDTAALMGKSSNFVGESPAVDSDKTDAPCIEIPVPSIIEKQDTPDMVAEPAHVDTDRTTSNLDSDIFDEECGPAPSSQSVELDIDGVSAVDVFGGIESEKALARYDLVDSSEEDRLASVALRRVERLAAGLAATITRLELLDTDQ